MSVASERPLQLLALVTLALAASCQGGAGDSSENKGGAAEPKERRGVPVLGYTLVASHPHDPGAYCQGLLFADGFLYESTGKYGRSSVRRVNIGDGKVLDRALVPPQFFGEGLALWEDKLIQVTWKSHSALVYDKESLEVVGAQRYAGEGWGLTSDGVHLILSDGTDELRFLDPETFETLRSVRVKSGTRPVFMLNELEYVNGRILANVWRSNRIARIDPRTGNVEAWIDLKGIADFPPVNDPDAVLNGIAYDAATGRLWVTGKFWPRLYQIEVAQSAD